MKLKIDEAKAFSLLTKGVKVVDSNIYNRIWSNSSPATAYQNWQNLRSGLTRNPRHEWIGIIAEETGAPIPLITGEEKVSKITFEKREK